MSVAQLSPEHLFTLANQSELAVTYKKQGRWEAAEWLETQTLERSTGFLAMEHPHTLHF